MSLKVKNLTKFYDTAPALNHINLDIKSKQIFGLLGPNGAGKSTFIRMLSQLGYPDSGEITINNRNILNNREVKAIIGLVPQKDNLHRELTVFENLMYHGLYYGMDSKEAAEKAGMLIKEFYLAEKADKNILTLSGGMRQRVLIARALMQSPEILIMDEPTVGLDPLIRKELWNMIRKLKERHTVLLTTQYIEEADALCDEVAILDEGKLITQGSPAALKKEVGDTVVEFRMKSSERIDSFIKRFRSEFKNMDISDRNVRISANREDMNKIIHEITAEGAEDIRYHETTLEDVFIKYTHKPMREKI